MLIAMQDRVQSVGSVSVGHIATPGGSSSVTAPDTLPISFVQTARVGQFCRFTTTATVTNSAQGTMTILISFPSVKRTRLVAVLGHNLVESDQFQIEAFSDIVFGTTALSVQNFDCTRTSRYYLQQSPTTGALPLLNGYQVIEGIGGAGLNIGSLRFTFKAGLYRSGRNLQIGRIWVSDAWRPDEQFSGDWQIDYVDQGKTDLARNGGMYFSDNQVLRRFTTKFPAMDMSNAVGTAPRAIGQEDLLTCYSDVVVASAGATESIILLREKEAARYRERMGIYGTLAAPGQLQQIALADRGQEYYSGTLQILERF